MAKREKPRPALKFNAKYFKDQLDMRGITQSYLAKLFHIHRAAITQLMKGKRKLQLEEATELARLLEVPLEEILTNAGIASDGVKPADSLPIEGWIDGDLVVHLSPPKSGIKRAPSFVWAGKGLSVLRFHTSGSQLEGMNGALVYFEKRTDGENGAKLRPEDVGRQAIIKTKAGQTGVNPGVNLLFGVVKRAASSGGQFGRFDIYSLAGAVLRENCQIESVWPVVWLKL